MNAATKDVDSDHWLSTYGLITIERIFGKYQIKLSADKIAAVIRNQFGFYHDILRVPLKNVLNGIIIQQTHDYYVYAQKLFIDYLLSSETASTEDAPGASIRDSLEEERSNLIQAGDYFHELELRQDTLICQSQAYLIQITQEWKTELEKTLGALQLTLKNSGLKIEKAALKDAIDQGLVHCNLKAHPQEAKPVDILNRISEALNISLNTELKENMLQNVTQLLEFSHHLDETLTDFYSQAKEITESACSFRTQMYDAILRSIDLIKLLPVYKIDPIQDQINKEVLYFDKTIGD